MSKFPRTLFDDSYEWMQKIVGEENKGKFEPEGRGVRCLDEHGCVSVMLSMVAEKKVNCIS